MSLKRSSEIVSGNVENLRRKRRKFRSKSIEIWLRSRFHRIMSQRFPPSVSFFNESTGPRNFVSEERITGAAVRGMRVEGVGGEGEGEGEGEGLGLGLGVGVGFGEDSVVHTRE